MKCLYASIAIFVIINCATIGGRRIPVTAEPEPIVISDLVGDKIDLDERDRYGLFTNIDDFVSAAFYERPEPEKGCKIILITEYKPYIAYNNEPLTLPILRDYIENYDSISLSRGGFEEKWQIVDYDTLGLPITQAEINKLASMSAGTKVLFVSGCGLIGACSGCMIGCMSAERDTDEHYGFIDTPDLSFAEGAKTGALIGAAIGIVAGIISLPTIVKSLRPQKVLSDIKKMRKPQEMK
jgi:hypothetical protein